MNLYLEIMDFILKVMDFMLKMMDLGHDCALRQDGVPTPSNIYTQSFPHFPRDSGSKLYIYVPRSRYEEGSGSGEGGAGNKTAEGLPYRDFYRVVVDNESPEDWVRFSARS